MREYDRNRQNATAVALEACPIANQISELGRKNWDGTATDLLQRLNKMIDAETRPSGWPKNPRALSGMVRRLATALRTRDIELEFSRDETPNRNRIIRIRPLNPKKNNEKQGV